MQGICWAGHRPSAVGLHTLVCEGSIVLYVQSGNCTRCGHFAHFMWHGRQLGLSEALASSMFLCPALLDSVTDSTPLLHVIQATVVAAKVLRLDIALHANFTNAR